MEKDIICPLFAIPSNCPKVKEFFKEHGLDGGKLNKEKYREWLTKRLNRKETKHA